MDGTCVGGHVCPPSELKAREGAHPMSTGRDTRQACELHALLRVAKFQSGNLALFLLHETQQESPGCPAVASRDQAVCLSAKHAQCQGSLRSHELIDADAEGAVLFPLLDLFTNRTL